MSQPAPSEFHPGDTRDFYEVIAINDGAAATAGLITVTDTLPAGVTVNAEPGSTKGYAEVLGQTDTYSQFISCEQATIGSVVSVTCRSEQSVPVGRSIAVHITVKCPLKASLDR